MPGATKVKPKPWVRRCVRRGSYPEPVHGCSGTAGLQGDVRHWNEQGAPWRLLEPHAEAAVRSNVEKYVSGARTLTSAADESILTRELIELNPDFELRYWPAIVGCGALVGQELDWRPKVDAEEALSRLNAYLAANEGRLVTCAPRTRPALRRGVALGLAAKSIYLEGDQALEFAKRGQTWFGLPTTLHICSSRC